jgi:tetratricopeptide (TPR) repeat protein
VCSLLLSPALRAGIAGAVDTVVLMDDSRLEGQVIELGGNCIELLMPSGSMKILRKDVKSVEFDKSRTGDDVAETDIVIRRDHHWIRGKVELAAGGERVEVTLPGGSRTVLPRKDVARIVKKGERLDEGSGHYTTDLARRIRETTDRIIAADGAEQAAHEEILIQCGIFAIDVVRAELKRTDLRQPARDAFARVDRVYRLKTAVETALEEAEPRIYSLLASGSEREAQDFLVFAFQRFTEESVPLAVFLALDDLSTRVVRSWCLEFLRRLQRNRELLDVLRRSTGPAQLAAAIALGKNQILVGVPTLIEALEMDSEEIRRLASESLRGFTGESFGYHPRGAPLARQEAVLRWRAWWQENEGAINESAAKLLRGEASVAPERVAARKLWKEANAAFWEGRLELAERTLREAVRTDPTFFAAQLNLAVVLYAHLDRTREALDLLAAMTDRQYSGVAFEEQGWVFFHLGNCRRLEGDREAALDAYRKCLIRQPRNLECWISVGEIELEVATRDADMKAEERRKLIEESCSTQEKALALIEAMSTELVALQAEELPTAEDLPFDRREHNQSVKDIRLRHRLLRAEVLCSLAEAESLLGRKEEAMKRLRVAVDEVVLEEGEAWRKIEAEMRTHLGLLYEGDDKPALALQQFRQVLEKIDPERMDAKQGAARVRRRMESASRVD